MNANLDSTIIPYLNRQTKPDQDASAPENI